MPRREHAYPVLVETAMNFLESWMNPDYSGWGNLYLSESTQEAFVHLLECRTCLTDLKREFNKSSLTEWGKPIRSSDDARHLLMFDIRCLYNACVLVGSLREKVKNELGGSEPSGDIPILDFPETSLVRWNAMRYAGSLVELPYLPPILIPDRLKPEIYKEASRILTAWLREGTMSAEEAALAVTDSHLRLEWRNCAEAAWPLRIAIRGYRACEKVHDEEELRSVARQAVGIELDRAISWFQSHA